jgi:hypothetical protein
VTRQTQDIACQQVLVEDSSVFSLQRSDFPAAISAGLTPAALLDHYLTYLRRTTLAIIRPTTTPDGIQFRLLQSNKSLISFLPPEADSDRIALRICGGLLVQPQQCHRGELFFAVEPVPGGTRVTLQLSDYCPLILGSPTPSPLRRWLYRLTQAFIHRLVTIRFLAHLYRELSGGRPTVRIVKVTLRDGRPV